MMETDFRVLQNISSCRKLIWPTLLAREIWRGAKRCMAINQQEINTNYRFLSENECPDVLLLKDKLAFLANWAILASGRSIFPT